MIKALIFDFDGLIIDTEGPDYQAWSETFESFGCALPFAKWAAEIGTYGAFDPYDDLARQLGRPVDRAIIRERRHARFAALMEQQAILPGVERYLREAQQRGLRVGVASSSPRSWVAGYLVRFGLDMHFACLTCGDDVERVKPEPDLYIAALQQLGAQPHEAIAFEDSPNGALAAARAGIFCVAVPNPLTRQLTIAAANMQLTSLANLPLADLLAYIDSLPATRPAP